LTKKEPLGPPLRLPPPNRRRAYLCAGWGPQKEHGARDLSEPHAGLWFYGRFVRLRLRAEKPTSITVTTEGRRFAQPASGSATLTVGYVARRWHLLALDLPASAVLRLHLTGVQVFR
jgi:hypothetical protein